jgi:CO/xanthine dehydrogenase Mo-binding subunit
VRTTERVAGEGGLHPLQQAEVRVSATCTYPAQRHHPIDLPSTAAVWDGPRLTVYETTQGVSMTRLNHCDLLDLQPENVRVISRFLRGGLGVKGVFWIHAALTALAARQVGRPVKLVITRGQMTAMMGYREQQRQDMTLGATRDGTLTAIRHHKLGATSEDRDDQINVLGVKGLGELPATGVPPAIANAIYHATGRRIRDLPIRSEMSPEPAPRADETAMSIQH